MKTPMMLENGVRGQILAALLLQAIPMALHADVTVGPPLLEFATGLPGKQVRLTWQAQDGVRYHVEKATDLSPGSWKRVAPLSIPLTDLGGGAFVPIAIP